MKAIQGTPPPSFFPAKNYVMQMDDEHKGHIIKLPRKGKYKDLDPEFFTEEDGEFQIVSDEGFALNMNVLTRVMFATKQYPDLNFDQLFVPHSIVVRADEVIVIGQEVRMLAPVEQDEKKGDA
jgi:hypothetical protein